MLPIVMQTFIQIVVFLDMMPPNEQVPIFYSVEERFMFLQNLSTSVPNCMVSPRIPPAKS